MIRGETVILIGKAVTDTDPFGQDIYTEVQIPVDDVLVGSPSTDDIATDLNLNGKKLAYTLGIPRGDSHDWQDKDVIIRGERFRTYGYPLTQNPLNTPTRWNTQVKVERYGS